MLPLVGVTWAPNPPRDLGALVIESCTKALGRGECRSAPVDAKSEDERLLLDASITQRKNDVVVRVVSEETPARSAERTLHFSADDPDGERAKTVGFAIASLATDLLVEFRPPEPAPISSEASTAEPTAQSVPPSTMVTPAEASAKQPAEAPKKGEASPQPAPRPQEREQKLPLALGLSGTLASARDNGTLRYGIGGNFRLHLGASPYYGLVGVTWSTTPVGADDLSLDFLEMGFGMGLRSAPVFRATRLFGELALDSQVLWGSLPASYGRPSQIYVLGLNALAGLEIELGYDWSLLLGGGLLMNPGVIELELDGTEVGHVPALQPRASLGLSCYF